MKTERDIEVSKECDTLSETTSLYTHYRITSQIFPFFFFSLPRSPLPIGLSAKSEVIKQIPFYSVNAESVILVTMPGLFMSLYNTWNHLSLLQ